MLYILLAGGVFNAVLVPQLVRAATHDAGPGRGVHQPGRHAGRAVPRRASPCCWSSRAPWLMRLFVDPGWPPDAKESVVDFARYCLPQVFFYGMYVLLGQILNARGRFGPMMWAPIANNVISVAMLVTYLVVFGAGDPSDGGYTAGQEAAARHRVDARHRRAAADPAALPAPRPASSCGPRFDFRGTGLGHTLRLGVWTVLFVVVNQIAYTVVVRLSSGGTASGDPEGTGYSVYSATFLIMMVPHSVVTVSLATAILPGLSRRATAADLAGLGGLLAGDAAHGPGRRRPVRRAAAGHRAAAGGGAVRLRRGGAVRRELRALAGAVRPGPGRVHGPLLDAARVLRARADPHGLRHPVRRGRDQHRGRGGAGRARPTTAGPPRRWSAPTPRLPGRLGRLGTSSCGERSAGCARPAPAPGVLPRPPARRRGRCRPALALGVGCSCRTCPTTRRLPRALLDLALLGGVAVAGVPRGGPAAAADRGDLGGLDTVLRRAPRGS